MTQEAVVGTVLKSDAGQASERPGGCAETACALIAELVPGATMRSLHVDVGRAPSGPTVAQVRIVQADPARKGGLLGAEVSLADAEGLTEQGTVTLWAPEVHADDLDPRRRVASPAWAELLVDALEGMPEFATATDYYDGTIGLSAPGRHVQLKIYKGRVVDASRRTVRGADFTLSASGGTWLDLLEAPTNEFMHRAMDGAFTTDGDGYEYLRATKLLVLVVDAARAIARDGGQT